MTRVWPKIPVAKCGEKTQNVLTPDMRNHIFFFNGNDAPMLSHYFWIFVHEIWMIHHCPFRKPRLSVLSLS